MSKDDFSAPLDAAVNAWIAARCSDPPGTTYDILPEQRVEIAAAIAAFHRALPGGLLDFPGFCGIDPGDAEQIADAVTEAAKLPLDV